MGPPGIGQRRAAAARFTLAARAVRRIWEGSGVAFREVGVHEIREVLRLWLRGEGLRSVARLAGVDRKTVRRDVAVAQACGLDGAGVKNSSAMSCWPRWPSGSARTGPMGTGRAGRCWRRVTP